MAGEFGYLETKSLERCEVWVGETTHVHHIPVFKVIRLKAADVAAWKAAHDERWRQEYDLAPHIFFGMGVPVVLALGSLAWETLHNWFPSLPALIINNWTVGLVVLLMLAMLLVVVRADNRSRQYAERYRKTAQDIFAKYGIVSNHPPDHPRNPTGYVLLYENGDRIT